MSLISALSILAAVLGLSGAVPQIARMLRAGSAAGQSIAGWLMGAVCNACMIYVNFFGYHAPLLAAGNFATFALCAAAVSVIAWLHRRGRGRAQAPAPAEDLVALPTQEFQILAEAVRTAERRRLEHGPVAC